MTRHVFIGVLAVAWAFGTGLDTAASSEAPPSAITVVREFGLAIPMPDGARLAADVYRPSGPARVPTLLLRTPYMRTLETYREQAHRWATQGYAFVVQDVRGRGDSSGEFEPLVHEGADGDATISWIAQQPWSDGTVGTLGGSYSGWTQVFAAPHNNPHLRAMIPIVTPSDPGGFWPMRRGGVSLGMLEWAMLVQGRTNRNVDGSAPEVLDAYRSAPLAGMDQRLGARSAIWQDYLAHLDDEPYWQPRSYQRQLSRARTPMLHVTGWYDGTLGGSLENFQTMRAQVGPTRDQQYLMVGPWRHWVDEDSRTGAFGGVDFGSAARVDLDRVYRSWFDHHLRRQPSDVVGWPHVQVFELGSHRWIGDDEWPLPRTRFVPVYLASGAAARLGVLSLLRPTVAHAADRYRYDPNDPTPFLWERNVDSGGPDDYRVVEARDDVLVYTMPPASEALHVCGPIRATLYAASSARDTDWVARLTLVHASGYSQRLTDGWVRARARRGNFLSDPLTPGAVERYDLDLWGTCVAVQPGQTLRLAIMSAAFPILTRNLNTGGPLATESVAVVADQAVHRSHEYPSHIVLPIVDRPRYVAPPALRP